MNKIQVDAFWSKVDIKSSTRSCWEWRAAKKPNGYGNVRINKKYKLAHRIAFELVNQPIPDGFMVCHICDNPSCCNPSHMMLGSNKSNSMDMLIKNRQKGPESACRGSVNGNSKLIEKDVKDIRNLHRNKEKTREELSKIFGVTKTTIGYIIRNKTWRHVK